MLLCTFIRNLSFFLQNVLQHAADYFRIFSGFFEGIPRNVWLHSLEYLATFTEMFEDIPWNVWGHSPEYSIPPIPRVPRISFPVPVFLVLYIAIKHLCNAKLIDTEIKNYLLNNVGKKNGKTVSKKTKIFLILNYRTL